MEKNWRGVPFRPISEFYKERFGGKVYKIPLATAEDCPNRLGLKGMKTCAFCDVWGSAARAEALTLPLETQLTKYTQSIGTRFNTRKFLAYFQAYTSTFTALPKLRSQIETTLAYEGMLGFVVGTRPDCLSKAAIDLWRSYAEKHFVGIELGVQSFDEDQLEFLRRGHTGVDSIEALEKLGQYPELNLSIHLMFGLPGETDEQMIETAKKCNELPIQSVKLHNLHVLKQTHLETLFHTGDFQPIDRETYARRVGIFLSHLSPRIYVHRLAAFASRFDELVAPDWTKDKMGTHQFIIQDLRRQRVYQGQNYVCSSVEEEKLLAELALRSVPISESVKAFQTLAE